MATRVLAIGGDGIGPEVTAVARAVLVRVAPKLDWDEGEAGWDCFQRCGASLPAATIEKARAADAVLFGAVTTPPGIAGYASAILGLRRALGLYANVRPARSAPVEGSRPGIDLVIVRENSEGLYSGIERREGGRAVAVRVVTVVASQRIVRHAFELARREERRTVTVVHKANVLRETCGLFRETALAVAADYPGIACKEMLVDTCAMNLVLHPERFDVIVTTNLFGDILSDEAAALVGGLGLAASANVGERGALFEPVHGSAPDIAGRGCANPLGAVRSAALLLEHLGLGVARRRVEAAVDCVLRQGPLTPDLGGTAGTADVERALLDALA